MIDLYTAPTPNGWKASVALEELELPYRVQAINLAQNEQKEAWHLRLNPNGRIPTIVDRDDDDFAVFETGAILIYSCTARWPLRADALDHVRQPRLRGGNHL